MFNNYITIKYLIFFIFSLTYTGETTAIESRGGNLPGVLLNRALCSPQTFHNLLWYSVRFDDILWRCFGEITGNLTIWYDLEGWDFTSGGEGGGLCTFKGNFLLSFFLASYTPDSARSLESIEGCAQAWHPNFERASSGRGLRRNCT